MTTRLLPSLITAATLVAASSANAATLAQYVPTGAANSSPANAPINATTIDSLVNASIIGNLFSGTPTAQQLGTGGAGPVRTANGTWNFSGDGGWIFANAGNDGANATASSTADYFNFTLSTPGTETLALNTLSFNYGVGGNTALASSSTWYYAVFASVDGGAFNQLGSTFSSTQATLTANTTVNLGAQSIDLSTISGAESVEFRIWVGSTNSNNSYGSIFRNITVDGSVSAVPEPSTYGLLGAGALAAVAFVRRRRKQAGAV